MFDSVKIFYYSYYRDNFYFPMQFLFSWTIFKILGLLKVGIFVRLLLAITFLFVLLFCWKHYIPGIFRNFIFQFYLLSFYHLINLFLSFSLGPLFLGFGLGCSSFVFSFNPYCLDFNTLSLFLPNLDYLLFVLLLFNFFKRFNASIIIEEMKTGFGYSQEDGQGFTFSNPYLFYWGDVVKIMECYLKHEFKIENKIFYFQEYPLKYFPFHVKFLNSLRELNVIDIKSSLSTIAHKLVMIANKADLVSKTFDKKETDRLLSEAFSQSYVNSIVRNQLCVEASKTAETLNNSFFWGVVKGLLLGFFFSLFLLNL